MIKFFLTRFVNKEKLIESLENHEDKIVDFSEQNKHLTTVVKTGFKIWSIWKIILIIWWGLLLLLFLGVGYILFHIISKFI